MFKKILPISLILAAGLVGLTGCSGGSDTEGFSGPVYTDKTLPQMGADIEQTVCAVKGKKVMTEQDVESFYLLSSALKTYEGSRREQALQVATKLESLAVNWQSTLGTDLGEKNADELTTLCESVRNANANS